MLHTGFAVKARSTQRKRVNHNFDAAKHIMAVTGKWQGGDRHSLADLDENAKELVSSSIVSLYIVTSEKAMICAYLCEF